MSKRKRRLRDKEPLDLTPPPAPAPSPPSTSFLAQLFSRKDAEALLREKIMDFAYQPRFGNSFERALELYFGKAARNRTLVADEEELPGFQEWYFFDFVLPSGRRLVDRFAEEVGPTLPEAEARLLAAWREMNRLRLFEVQSVMPGTGVVVLDLLSGETLTVNDRSASRSLRRWMVILARPSQAVDRICFTGSSTALTPMYKKDMLEAAQKLWDEYRMQYPEAAFSDFYCDCSLDLLKAMQRLQEEAMRPPIFLSAEGHKLVEARAEYVVRDFQAVVGRLDSAEEFVDVGPSDDEPDATHFDWLLRGRSNVPETPAPERGAVMLKSEFIAGPGAPAFRSLGDVTLWKGRLELECISRERLQAGKALLAEILGDLVTHKRDRVRPMNLQAQPSLSSAARSDPSRPRSRKSREEVEVEREMVERMTGEWLNTPSPALHNLPPCQAINTPEGRAEIVEILKHMEYLNDERQAQGEPPTADIARIRRELGLPPS